MTPFVLIVMVTATALAGTQHHTTRVDQAGPITMQEFSSEGRCAEAAEQIRRAGLDGLRLLTCVPK